jgi:hypothetical protein
MAISQQTVQAIHIMVLNTFTNSVNVTGAGANAFSVTGTSTLGNAGVVADQALVVNGNATFNENVNVVGTLSSGNFAPANITTPG